ncbi:MAG: hypothetical protein QOE83_112 [Actinomycetota bacterium]|nr:hypothetical protein [Actinomycetota bacterium]
MPQNEPPAPRAAHPWRNGLLVGLVFAVAAGIYVAVRWGATTPEPNFLGACQRLRASGLAITSKDWFCRPAPWTHHAAYLGASFLMWLTFVAPCSILAATGRRFTALLPMAVAPFFTFRAIDVEARWWGTAFWPGHPASAIVLNILCIAAPVAVVWFANRNRRPRPEGDPSMVSIFGSAAVLILPTIAVVMLYRHMAIGESVGLDSPSWTVVLPLAVFGALLGPDRRWWPWSVAPVAVLVSFGPTVALLSLPLRFQIWTLFGSALPLAAVGVLWAAWWPLSLVITRAHRRQQAPNPERTLAVPLEPDDVDAVVPAVPPARRRNLRPIVVLDSLAISLLVISLIMFRTDPVPIQIGTALPTFLGERAHWQDVRTRLDLRQAMSAMDAYAAAHGSYQGFTATSGAKSDHSLAWADLLSLHSDTPVPRFTMIVAAAGSRARIGAESPSGAAFCIGRDSPEAVLTYGTQPGHEGKYVRRPLERALAACGESPWTAHLEKAMPIEPLCDGMDGSSGYVICRMVQALAVNIMSTTKPI